MRLFIANDKDSVNECLIEQFRGLYLVNPKALDFMRAGISSAQRRAVGLHKDCVEVWILFLEKANHPRKGSRRAGSQHDDVDLATALRVLRQGGVGTVCCEGGPTLNGHLLVADLVDEWDLTISPLLVGGGEAGRAVTGPALPAPHPTELSWLLTGDGLLLGRWLRVR